MKYTRIKNPDISKLSQEQQEFSILKSADLIRSLASKIKYDAIQERHLCEFEDGRKNWMVTYDKYFKVKNQNLELKKENENLKAAILKLSASSHRHESEKLQHDFNSHGPWKPISTHPASDPKSREFEYMKTVIISDLSYVCTGYYGGADSGWRTAQGARTLPTPTHWMPIPKTPQI